MTPPLVLLAILLAAPMPKGSGATTDWPQWRGPNRDGIAAEQGLLETWPKDGPKLAWELRDLIDIGAGYGSPAVVGDKVYIIGANGAKQDAAEFVTCLAVATGKRIWQTPLTTTPGKFNDGWGGGPRSTPTIDNGMLCVLGATGDLVAMDCAEGKIQWTKNLVKDFGGKIPTWGYSESVLIDGEQVVCTPGSKFGMIALNKATGKTIWQCKEFTDGAGYSSIVIAEVGGVKQYVQQTMTSAVGVRASDGKLLWKAGEIGRKIAVIPTPVLADGYAFFTAGYGAGCELFQLTPDGDAGTKATTVYTKNSTFQNHHGGVVRLGDYLYGHSDAGGWLCFDMKKGEDVWKDKGVGKGSVSSANGYLYCYGESNGTLALVKAAPQKYDEVSRFKIPATSKLRPNSGKVWAHPVIAGGKLYLRDYELLYVYDIRAK